MRRRLSVAGFVIVVGLYVSIPTVAGAVGAAPTGSTNVPAGVGLCQRGGWRTLTNAQGQPFGNQGQCISYFIHNPVSLADLAGSFSGTTTWTFGSGNDCFVNQAFAASYLGNSAVGAVAFHVGGCVNPPLSSSTTWTFAGTFTIATNVGTLAGDTAGPFNGPDFPTPPDYFELTLTIVSGTGAFAATTGTIHVSILWSSFPSNTPSTSPVAGSVTIP